MRFQHRGENDAMENDIVLTNKVHQLGVFFTPVIGPLIGQFLGSRNITNGGIEPYVQYFSFCIWQWHFHAPVAVARHCTALQAAVEPASTLAIYVVLPLF